MLSSPPLAGAAPLRHRPGSSVRHRLNRGGNRRLNCVLYRIAITQAHHSAQARAYIDRRVAEGKTRREARRALTRLYRASGLAALAGMLLLCPPTFAWGKQREH